MGRIVLRDAAVCASPASAKIEAARELSPAARKLVELIARELALQALRSPPVKELDRFTEVETQ